MRKNIILEKQYIKNEKMNILSKADRIKSNIIKSRSLESLQNKKTQKNIKNIYDFQKDERELQYGILQMLEPLDKLEELAEQKRKALNIIQKNI